MSHQIFITMSSFNRKEKDKYMKKVKKFKITLADVMFFWCILTVIMILDILDINSRILRFIITVIIGIILSTSWVLSEVIENENNQELKMKKYLLYLSKPELDENIIYKRYESINEAHQDIKILKEKFGHKFFAIKKEKKIVHQEGDEIL